MKIHFQKSRSFVLSIVLCIVLILVVIIIPLISWAVNEFSWTAHSFKSLQALNLADAGAELAIWEIAYNSVQFTGWSGTNPKVLKISSFLDNLAETIGDVVISAENTSPDHYLIVSTGFIPTEAKPIVQKTVKVKVFPHPLFNNGIFGNTSVTLTGNALVDSYNSNIGAYDPFNAGANGDVGTNGTMTLLENSMVNGDIFIGPSGSVTGDVGSHMSGEDYYSGFEVELEEVPFDSAYFFGLPSGGNLMLSGKDTMTIPSGDYRYESISVEAKSSLIISSFTRIYVHNNFYVAGQGTIFTNDGVELFIGGDGNFAGNGIVNTTAVPNNLIIYGVGSGANFSYTGSSDFYGTFYAPESSVYLAGGANFYGSIIADDVELAGNIEFHFDEALLTEGPMVGYDIAYWQED